AVITSATGAAVRDVIETARQRCAAVGLLVVDVRVQGEAAAKQIAGAIRWVDANRSGLAVDAILVTRGGGSIEDLWAFNERVVADATLACALPVVAAIGHESDTTIIELVADQRASTPTQAAMRLVPSRAELLQQVEHLQQRIEFLARRRVESSRQRLELLARHEAFRDPGARLKRAAELVSALGRDLLRTLRGRVAHGRADVERLAARVGALTPVTLVADRRQRVAVLAAGLDRVLATNLRRERTRLMHLARELAAVDPRAVLGRGYSYTTHPDGRLIRSVSDVRAGDALVTRVADGRIDSVVGRRIRGAPASRSDDRPGADQMDLFEGSG
ncbi:MAG: exodeoxyribonuclease VII large subunit, partial [Planctomycetota bacterium]